MKALLLISLCALASCLLYQGEEVPSNWHKVEKVSHKEIHTVTFAIKLKEGADAQCGNILMKVSDPKSPSYGQYLTRDDIKATFSDLEATKAVEQWLKKHNIAFTTSYMGDFIEATASIHKFEKLLKAKFYHFEEEQSGKRIQRCASFVLPSKIAKHIDFVSNTIHFPPTHSLFLSPLSEERQSQGNIYPQLLGQAYNIDSNNAQNNNQSLFEALGQNYSPSDLTAFQQKYNLPTQSIANVIGPNNGAACTQNPNNCAEANLDVQYIMAIAQNSPTTYWSINQNSQDPFVDWIVALGNTANPPLVHSISYGSIAKEDSQHDMSRFNTEACKLGLRGVTILVASGDDGVANFVARNDPTQCGFSPSFPATSPYVTAVGATQGVESGQPEVACSSATGGVITTGGGFSFYFSRPSYQNTPVATYLQTAPNLPPSNLFNGQGRGYPDLALAGFNYIVVIGGQFYQLSGTSASTPVFAGMVSLINSARIGAGKPPVGFLNPAIYQIAESDPSVFHDITVGENNCCAYNGPNTTCCQYGFNATTGWDPLTGFGSVNFAQLKRDLLSM